MTRVQRRGRTSALEDVDFAKEVASAFVAGLTRRRMAEMFSVNEWTITQWRRDPRVKVHAMKMIEDRVLAVTRRVDSEIEGRLQNPGDLTVKELLEIRKEYLGGKLREQTENVDDDTMHQAMELLEKYPELASQMVGLLNGTATVVPKDNVIEGEGSPVSDGPFGV